MVGQSLSWTNVATPPMLPGGTVAVTVVFTAEHPKPVVVNHAHAQDIIHSSGSISATAATSETQEAIGGNVPILKSLWPTNTSIIAGFPVTFTQLITNDGAVFLTHLPLTDTYDASVLTFNFAIPTIISPPGQLVWTNLADPTYFGPISPFHTLVVTTVFTATTDVITTINEASTEGVRDEYDNDLTAGQAQVPIVILPAPTKTPKPTKTPAPPQPQSPPDTSAPPSATPTWTPLPPGTVTPPPPEILPETGQRIPIRLILIGLGLGVLALGGYGAARAQTMKGG